MDFFSRLTIFVVVLFGIFAFGHGFVDADESLGDPEPPLSYMAGSRLPRGFVEDQFALSSLCFTQGAVSTVINSWVVCDNAQVEIRQCIDVTARKLSEGELDFDSFPPLRVFFDPLSARIYSLDNRRLAIAKYLCDQINGSAPLCNSPIPVVWATRLEVLCTANNIPNLEDWTPPGYSQTCRELGYDGNHWDSPDQGATVNIRPDSFAGTAYADKYKCSPWYDNSLDTSSTCGQPIWTGNKNQQWFSSTGKPLRYTSPVSPVWKCSSIASPSFSSGKISISVVNSAGQRTRVQVSQSPTEAEMKVYSQAFEGGNIPTLIGAFVPTSPSLINSLWRSRKDAIAVALAPIPVQQYDTTAWRNAAGSTEDLYNLAHSHIYTFKALVQTVLNDINGDSGQSYASFGPRNRFITKTLSSLQRKVSQQRFRGVTSPWLTIGNAIRGTIIVPSVEAFKLAVSSLLSAANTSALMVSLDNKFEQTKKTGYVGVHAAVLLNQELIGEVQFHFRQIMDGTPNCPKENSQRIDQLTRVAPQSFRWSAAEANSGNDFADDSSQRYNSWSYGWRPNGEQNAGQFNMMTVFDNSTSKWMRSEQEQVPFWSQSGGKPSDTLAVLLRYTYSGTCPTPVGITGFFQLTSYCAPNFFARIRKNSAKLWEVKPFGTTPSYFSLVTRLSSGDHLDFELEYIPAGSTCGSSQFMPEITTLSYCPDQFIEAGYLAQKFNFLYGLQRIPLDVKERSIVTLHDEQIAANLSVPDGEVPRHEFIYSSGVLYRTTSDSISIFDASLCSYKPIGFEDRLEDLDISGTLVDSVHSARVVAIERSLCNAAISLVRGTTELWILSIIALHAMFL